MLIHARTDAGAVQGQNVLIVGRVFGHIRDEAAGGVPLRHQLVVDGRKRFLGQEVRQHVGHLGPGGGLGQLPVQLRAQDALRLEVAEIGLGGGHPLRPEGGGAQLRFAGTVQAADAPGEDDGLSHCQGVL